MSTQPIGFVSRNAILDGKSSVEDVINRYKTSLGEDIDISNLTFTSYPAEEKDGYVVSVSTTGDPAISYQGLQLNTGGSSITVSTDSANYDPNDPKWTWQPGPTWTSPSITIPAMPSQVWPAGSGGTVELLEALPAELSDESKALLKSVEEKVSELLGKHPYARYANMRKALDEILAGKEDECRFEGCHSVPCVDGRDGWVAKWSRKSKYARMESETIAMPTEIEAIAELIRMVM